MAEGGHDELENASEECLRSLHIREKNCGPCRDGGTVIQPHGFCVDCDEYLCLECCRIHPRARAYRGHNLQLITNKLPENSKTKEVQEKCSIHTNVSISWYCKSHDMPLCDLCKTASHGKCDEVTTLHDASKAVFDSIEYTKLRGQLMNLIKEFDQEIAIVKSNATEADNLYHHALEEITKALSYVKNCDKALMKSIESTCNATLLLIKGVVDKLTGFETYRDKEQAFLLIRKVINQLELFVENLKLAKKDNKITKYLFLSVQKVCKTGLFGVICDATHKPVKIGEINIKSPSDKSHCFITGIEKIDEHRLVVTDLDNYKIKMIDLTNHSICSELKLKTSPWDVTKIDDKNVAITTYKCKTILLLSIDDNNSLRVIKTIDKSMYTYSLGITHDNGLIVSYNIPSRIEVLDLDGSIIKTINNKDIDGNVRFKGVDYIAKNFESDILYLSDNNINKVLSINHDGFTAQIFSHKKLKNPRGLTIGRDGNVLVCSNDANCIFELSADLSKGGIALSEDDGIRNPWSILCDGQERTLYIGSSSSTLQVFLV